MIKKLCFLLLIVTMFVFASAGCKDGGDKIVLLVGNNAPQISVIPDQQATVSFPFTLDLSAYVTDDHDAVTALTFLPVSGGGGFTGSLYENTFDTVGPVTVQFLVLDTETGFAAGAFNVNVLSPPTADFTADTTYGPATLSVNFSDLSTGDIDAWAWDFGDTGTSTEQNPAHDYTAPGWYDVSLTVSGSGGSHTRTRYAFIQVLAGGVNIWYVDAATTATTPDGTSWATAFPVIQSGITAATDGDMVFVADGTYTGTSNKNLGFGGRLIYVAAYDLYGSGDSIIDCESAGPAFLIVNGETNEAVVDGFTIINGNYMGGAGITCSIGSSPTIVNCTIRNCYAGIGAAIYVGNSSQPIISNCVLTGNTSGGDGGAVMLSSSSDVIIAHCSITGNHATGHGGGIYGENSTGIVIYDCVIENNTADQEGGGIYTSYCPATMTDTSLSRNFTGLSGGGLYFYQSTITMTNCRVDKNRASSDGGGICGDDSETSLYMTGCTVNDNAASGWGGGIYLFRLVSSLTDCSVCGNETAASEANGGGVFAYDSEITLTGCTLANNRVVSIDDPCGGGALQTYATNATMLGCTVYGNSVESGAVWAEGGGLHFRAVTAKFVSITNCSITRNTVRGIDTAYGGGVYFDSVAAQVTGSTILGNIASELGTADVGEVFGGGICSVSGETTITNSTISENTAE